jgi:hypothetical protein
MHTTTTTPAPVLSVGALLPVSPAYRAVLTKVDTGSLARWSSSGSPPPASPRSWSSTSGSARIVPVRNA